MSELTNIHARAAKDLTTPTNLPADPNALDQVKLVAGNFPKEYTGNEALTVGFVKELAAQGREAELEEVLQKATQKVTQEETRAKAAEGLLSQNKADKTYVDASLTAITGGRKAYPTLASALADTSTFTRGVIIEVVLDGANNGAYWWNGADLYKSDFDPLTHAKAYTDQAEANAKDYADQNKLDIRKIPYAYQGGNLIGPKSARYTDFGVSSAFAISAASYYDSVVIPVNADDVLFVLNDKQSYAAGNGAAYAFFAEDPYLNRTQARIVDNRTTSSIKDPETGLSYIQVTVPTGANYLILNTRYNNAAGTVSTVFNWAIHSGAFNSSYGPGTEVITHINDVKVPTVFEVEKIATTKANAAQQAATADATTKADAAEANAKDYADQNKLDIKKVQHSYQGGNLIGPKSALYSNFGLSTAFVISAAIYYDSVVIPITEGDILYLLNDKQTYSLVNGAAYAFFAEDPYLNRTQERIVDNRSSSTVEQETGLSYVQVTVPTGANYLILNTRYNNIAGTVSNVFNWAIHSGTFNSSYEQGTEVITRIDDVKVPTVIDVKKLSVEKLGISEIETRYVDGNMIGESSKRVLNFGLNDIRVLLESNVADSTIIPVDANSLLCIYNDKNTISNQARATYAFFAEDPSLNKTQSRILHTETSKTNAVSDVAYREVRVPEGAKYLILNHRVTLAATGTINYNWAVHKDSFVYSFEQGREYVSKVKGLSLSETKDLGENRPLKSVKNLYKGLVLEKSTINDAGTYNSANVDDTLAPFIPVEFGKTYTISGLSLEKMGGGTTRVLGLENNVSPSNGFVQLLASAISDKFTITISDNRIKFITFPLTRNNFGTVEDAKRLPIQVELGDKSTSYEPGEHTQALLRVLTKVGDSTTGGLTTSVVTQFTKLDAVRDANMSVLGSISSTAGPLGIAYKLKGASNVDHTANNLYAVHKADSKGTKAINVHLMKYVDDVKAVGSLNRRVFTVPSGSLDNPDSFVHVDKYPNYLSVHPSIAYTETPIAGFKYWMISSTYPPTAQGGVEWEDEDLFVSNDAVNWQRVRSLYETDKSYTTETLRLPPHSLETRNSRKYAFLPSLASGDSIEISVPESNGAPALERQVITLEGVAWKHDPHLLIDNGYIYTYHTFHLPTVDRPSGKNRFLICVRTNDGINWDVVRGNGSTMRITEENSRTLFTKDELGRYNYIYYGYDIGQSNPEVIKYGEGDYELFWGPNFRRKYIGTTPYSFDFNNPVNIDDLGMPHHPNIKLINGKLYVMSNKGMYVSENRGLNFTKLAHYPMWLGGVYGMSYKKTSCIGEGGKFILVDTQRCSAPAFSMSAFNYVNDINQLVFYEYSSFDDFLEKAQNGLKDAYIDLQLTKVNLNKQTREVLNIPYISATSTTGTGPQVLQRLKVADLNLDIGDTVYLHVTLNSRNGAEIAFGGIDIS